MKKLSRTLALLLTLVMMMGLMAACGNDTAGTADSQTDETPNIDSETAEESTLETETETEEAEEPEEDVSADWETIALETEYALHFYQYSEPSEEGSIVFHEDSLTFTHSDATTTEYIYEILSGNILSFSTSAEDAYYVCHYTVADTALTLNVLGVTSLNLLGEQSVLYTDQQSTANIRFDQNGVALEYNQVDVAGGDNYSDYEFRYAWSADSDESLFLLVFIDEGYIAYTVAIGEDGTMLLTYLNAFTYDEF